MDLNGDGIDDVITGDYMPGDVYLYQGSPVGFQAPVVIQEVTAKDSTKDTGIPS